MIKPLQRHSEARLMARALPVPAHKLSSDEAKHPAISAQQGLKVKHMLEPLVSDIGKEYICHKDRSLILKGRLLERTRPADLVSRAPGTVGDKPLARALWPQDLH